MKKSKKMELQAEEEEDEILDISSKSDISEILMERYSKSTASQHRHLCASAAAMKSILQEESLPLTPLSYFAATISSLTDADSDSDSVSALSSFLSIVIPLLPQNSLSQNKAGEAVDVLVELLKGEGRVVSTATVRCVVKCLGSLILLCDLEDWEKVRVPFETILGFSVDKRPKVRKCAQVCVEKVFKSFHCSVDKEASKVVLSFFKSYMPHAIQLNDSRFVDGSKREMLSQPEHLEAVHMLNSLKHIVPYLSKKVSQKILCDLHKLLTCHFSPFTRHLFNILEVVFESSGADVIVPEVDSIIASLASYVSLGERNPMDTVMSALSLLKSVMSKLRGVEPTICTMKLPVVFGSIAGLLVIDAYSLHAAGILKEVINEHMDGSTFLGGGYQVHEDEFMAKEESRAITSACAVFENILGTCDGNPNEHMLAVISTLFFKLGEVSYIFMKGILLKLAGLMILEERDLKESKHLQECIGSAIMAIGPEKMLTFIPVSFDPESHTSSNFWLIPVLNKYVTGASLEYFLKHIVPLVDSLRQACQKVKKSVARKLKAYIRGLLDLLPAFCRYPTDTHKCIEPLAKVLTSFLKEDSYMHENVALALQELVNQNKRILISTENVSRPVESTGMYSIADPNGGARSVPSHYSREVATRNIEGLSSCSMDLLLALTDVFFSSSPKNRTHLKEAIGCVTSITESSDVEKLFISLVEKFKAINVDGEPDNMKDDGCTSVDNDLADNSKKEEQEAKRCMLMEFAHALVAGAKGGLLDTVFNYIKPALQAGAGVGQSEAYCILNRIFEEHDWFCSSRFDEMVDLLLGVKPPVDIMTLRSRFSCFKNLFVYMLKSDLEDRNAKAFIILNEIILALKDCNEEARKAAYDVLLKISDSLNDSSSANSGSPHEQLFNMIMGYLSGAPPPIMSVAVAALSLLIYKNSGFCFSIPELVPSVLVLLRSKAKEVIKAVLGFVKVLVSSIQASDLQKLLPDIVSGILPWSSVSKNHFRSKVATIFEILIRKCGYSSVELLVPDRYKGFIKTVKEQRHGKSSTNEAVTSDTVSKPADSFPKRENKRRHGFTTQGEGTDRQDSSTLQMERTNKKRKFNLPSTNYKEGQREGKPKSFRSGKFESRTEGSSKPAKWKDWNKRSSTGVKDFKTSKTPIHRAGLNSKFHKRRKADE